MERSRVTVVTAEDVAGVRRAHLVRRAGRAAAAFAVALALVGPGWSGARAVPGGGPDDLADARRRVTEAQAAADAAAGRYQEALTQKEQLRREIRGLREEIEVGEAEIRRLELLVAERAAVAYTSASNGNAPFEPLGDDGPISLARRQELLGQVNERDVDAVDRLQAADEDLNRRRDELASRQDEQKELVAGLEADAAELNEQLVEAEQAQAVVEARLAAEAEARRREAERRDAERREAERRAAEDRAAEERAAEERAAEERAAEPTATTGAPPSTSGDPVPVPVPVPVPAPAPAPAPPASSGGIVCPINGPVSFVDSWGAPRHQGRHQGVDLMSPRGTSNVAVVSGQAEMRGGGISGNGVRLRGDDGSLYYYFHLDSYAGGSRRVTQGEVVGYTGSTGDAAGGATHTHFEIHPGGGAAVNPYPAVRAAC